VQSREAVAEGPLANLHGMATPEAVLFQFSFSFWLASLSDFRDVTFTGLRFNYGTHHCAIRHRKQKPVSFADAEPQRKLREVGETVRAHVRAIVTAQHARYLVLLHQHLQSQPH
jgi:hypothetical protein